jgi:hypothetical protein
MHPAHLQDAYKRTISEGSMFPERDRNLNAHLVHAIITAQSPREEMASVVSSLEQFHPSLLAEFDYLWRYPEAVLKQATDETRNLLAESAYSAALDLFLKTLPANLRTRGEFMNSDSDAALSRALSRYEKIIKEGDGSTESKDLLAAVEDLIGDSKRRRILPNGILGVVEGSLSKDLERCHDQRHAGIYVAKAVANSAFLLLDHPLTRLPFLSALSILWRASGERWPFSHPNPQTSSEGDAEQIARWLQILASAMDQAQLDQVATTFRTFATMLARRMELESCYDGELMRGEGACSICAMHFSSTAFSVLDETCPTVKFGEMGSIFIREWFNKTVCPFCGHRSPMFDPGLFYRRSKGFMVYAVPLPAGMDQDTALPLMRPMIEDFRARYRERLKAEDTEDFDNAIELVTHNSGEFMHAVHMGELVAEKHATMSYFTGTGRVWLIDPIKGFHREFTVEEYESYYPEADDAEHERFYAQMMTEPYASITRRLSEALYDALSKDLGAEFLSEFPDKESWADHVAKGNEDILQQYRSKGALRDDPD